MKKSKTNLSEEKNKILDKNIIQNKMNFEEVARTDYQQPVNCYQQH